MARSRFRSVRYDLSAAVEVARLVDSAGGAVAGDILAPALGYSGMNNGAYLTRVANARLFGLVAGRGSRFEVTERGHRILSGDGPVAAIARREAFLSVPLFRAVADAAEERGGLLPDDLAGWLVDDFGEVAGKAQTAADRLIASAGEANLLHRSTDGQFQLTADFTNFTPVDKVTFIRRIRQVGFHKRANSRQGEGVAVAENGLWLEEDAGGAPKTVPVWRRVGVAAAAAVVLVVVAVPVALVAAGSPSKPAAAHRPAPVPRLGNGPAEHQVLSALSATTDSGSFDFSYVITSAPPHPTPAATKTKICTQVRVLTPIGNQVMPVGKQSGAAEVVGGGSYSTGAAGSMPVGTEAPVDVAGAGTTPVTPPKGYRFKTERVCNVPVAPANPLVTGSGVINTNPLAMVASADIGNGLDVTVRVDGTDVYELSSGDSGLAPLPTDGSAAGTSLPQFAGITEGTLGSREGAVAMMGMASPTGYLDLIQPAIDAAARTGTGNVDGVPVTNYLVANNLDQLASAAGTTSAESQTIDAALTLLKAQGFATDNVVVSVDGSGYIRQVKATDTFGDGGKVTLKATFSNFGCAGTVIMPGQTGSGVPPTGCTSPDGTSPAAATGSSAGSRRAAANTATPTTAGSVPAPSTTATPQLRTSTTVGSGPAPSTTVTPPGSTTSTASPPTTVPGPPGSSAP
ncbi:MAG: hypothetical protein ABSF33_02285 [Acidimicrobiales bacterium]